MYVEKLNQSWALCFDCFGLYIGRMSDIDYHIFLLSLRIESIDLHPSEMRA